MVKAYNGKNIETFEMEFRMWIRENGWEGLLLPGVDARLYSQNRTIFAALLQKVPLAQKTHLSMTFGAQSDGMGAFRELCRTEKGESEAHVNILRAQAYAIIMSDYEDMTAYLSAKRNKWASVAVAQGAAVTRAEVNYSILAGLSSEYDGIAQTFYAREEMPETEELCRTLRKIYYAKEAGNQPGTKHKNQNAGRANKVTTTEPTAAAVRETPAKDQQDQQEDNREDKRDKGNNRGYQGRGRGVTCSFCNRPGHKEEECWVKMREEERKERNKKRENTCSYCGYRGHTQPECYKKIAAEERERKETGDNKRDRRNEGQPTEMPQGVRMNNMEKSVTELTEMMKKMCGNIMEVQRKQDAAEKPAEPAQPKQPRPAIKPAAKHVRFSDSVISDEEDETRSPDLAWRVTSPCQKK